MKEANRKGHGGHSGAVHLAGTPGIGQEETDEGQLNNGELRERWYHKTLLNSVNFVSWEWGVLFHSLAVIGHFYFIQRN